MQGITSVKSPQARDCVLRVHHLTTRLNVGSEKCVVVDDLSFELCAGQTIALVGESGCGKSMTALSILNLLPSPPALPPEGEVWFGSQNLLQLSARQLRQIRGRQLSMIFQDPMSALNPVYTIGNQLLEVVQLHLQLWGDEAQERIMAALVEVGIPSPEHMLFRYPHELSGGMKQRVMIAMAMVCQPLVLIADEPTTALDVTVQAQVLDLMRALQAKKGMGMLLITHDMGVVAELAHEVIIMYAGQAVERGSVDQIFDSPQHPYTRGLFASRPQTGQALCPIPGSVPRLGMFPSGCRFQPRCGKAMEICAQAPPVVEAEQGRQIRCWLASQSRAPQELEDA